MTNLEDYQHEHTELILFIDNESELYKQKQAIIAAMKKKVEAGKYDAAKAIVGWRHWVDAGARKYVKDFHMTDLAAAFPVKVRDAVAKEVSEREYQMILQGEYGKLEVPKVHRAGPSVQKPEARKAVRKKVEKPSVRISQVKLNRQGYTSSGEYFGVGQPLWRAYNTRNQQELNFRAPTREVAKEVAFAVLLRPKDKLVTSRFTPRQVREFTEEWSTRLVPGERQ